VIRLLNGTKLYLHGVVDNFSRRLLAWKLVEKLSPTTTCEVLAEAAKQLPQVQSPITVLTDGGVENVNDTVDQFLFAGILKRVLAQVEIVHAGPRSERSEEHAQRAVNRKAKTESAGKSGETKCRAKKCRMS
jgi:predicted alpha-1,6-mannanase (GH76 family)